MNNELLIVNYEVGSRCPLTINYYSFIIHYYLVLAVAVDEVEQGFVVQVAAQVFGE